MQNSDFEAQPTINFAKVVSVPTPFSWSQAYNAGKLFVVLSLEKNNHNEDEDSDSLNILGKNLLSKLEEEFFTLDAKNSASIKQAILATFKNVDEVTTYSFAASFFTANKLYIFLIGRSGVFIKRDLHTAKFVTVLGKDPKSVTSFAGNVKDNDLILLTTDHSNNFLNEDAFLEDKSAYAIADLLTPIVLGKEDGKISIIILKYSEYKPLIGNDASLAEQKEPKEQEERLQQKKNIFAAILNFKKYIPLKNIKLNHSKKVFLTLAIMVFVIFTSSVYFTIQKQETAKTQALFEETYPEAEKKYNEGNSLLGLNKNIARENFLESKKILQHAISLFSKNSKEEKQVSDLLKKVEDAISLSSGVNLVNAKSIDPKESTFLSLQAQKPQQPFTKDENNIYFADADAVYSFSKAKNSEIAIIKNSNSWQDAIALGVYFGNIYILDKSQKQILKFAPIQGGFGKSNYFASDFSPDFTSAVSMAIDGSIFVLLSDGTIQKFTRGNADQFTISGLDTPLSSPSKIFTDRNTSNIYILDNGNSRIVVLNKEGIYQNQYQTEILKTAKDFEVLEKDKKIYILSKNKVYEIEIK